MSTSQVPTPDHPLAVRVRDAEAKAGRGDPSDLQALQHLDMIVHAPGSTILGGDTRGREAHYAKNARMFEITSNTLKLAPLHVLATDDIVTMIAHVTAERPGRTPLNEFICEVWRFEDGLCVEVWDHFGDLAAWDAFWAEGMTSRPEQQSTKCSLDRLPPGLPRAPACRGFALCHVKHSKSRGPTTATAAQDSFL